MDFIDIAYRTTKRGSLEVYPNFVVCNSKDIMIRGKDFYAIWDEESGLWSTNELDVVRLVDKELYSYADELRGHTEDAIRVMTLTDFSSKSWMSYKNYITHFPDNYQTLDNRLIFNNEVTKREDYASHKLPYSLSDGECASWDELVGTLYSTQERKKIEWAIGSVFAGESKDIQKFFVFYGDAGTGKSTILNVIQWLFEGYYAVFDAKALGNSHNQFSLEAFKGNPLVAIQHDGDLSRIEDNTRLNSIVSHEEMLVNEKHKSLYSVRMNALLFMGTNKPVKITDAKSGIIRRLIDITPTGNKIPVDRYQQLMHNIKFELGAIAQHCLNVFKTLGKHHYDNYRSSEMQYKTDVFFNFVDANFFEFKKQEAVTLRQAYAMYKEYCQETSLTYVMPMYQFREELKNYFADFKKDYRIDGKHFRSCYVGFLASKIEYKQSEDFEEMRPVSDWLVMNTEHSLFDIFAREYPAQYANDSGTPFKKWENVDTTLADIDTKKLHYVKVPSNHIVIDFDLKDDSGEKSAEMNLEAANKWPETYAEFSKGGAGIHLHYIYDGDVEQLSRVYSEGIEIKVFNGNSSLRRRLSLCNDISIAHISGGLPTKERKVISNATIKSERALRDLVVKGLKKEVWPNTKPSIDFIFKVLDEAYDSGVEYDLSDMQTAVLAFAADSTHQARYCMDCVAKMHFVSKDLEERRVEEKREDKPIVFFDIEVFPNLLLVNYKVAGDGCPVIRMINPDPAAIESLFQYRLIGFNNRRYDNHILYARYLGHSIEDCYKQSQKIINGDRDAFFGEAYRLSYTDVYDFSSKKQSLKKFEIELGIHHQELGLPWDEPVDPKLWTKVAEYCDNDVIATEAVFNARHADFVAREILADLSGLTVNDTTNQHTTRIIFGDDPNPQSKFVYTDLSEMFPGYKFENGKSTYRGEDPSEGGYVYSEPGMYGNVALLDIASLHPTSIECLNLFGPYTARFSAIKQARIFIKHHDYDSAKKLMDGKLAKHLNGSEEDADALAYALKIAINSVYGLTSAKFPNKFKDPRNVDNIVAKRGALFMIDLKHAVQEKGWTVAHIKTDSIKIPDATPEMIDFVVEFGKKYGYDFEHEATYDKMCLVNKSTYIAKYANGKHAGEWTATGAQFQQPYVFKTLFSHEKLIFDDMCEVKNCKTAFYLDMNEGMKDGEHNYKFIGRAGQFTPVKPGTGGGRLVREQNGKYYSATDADGFRWMESETVRQLGIEGSVDKNYYRRKVDEAVKDISQYGDFEWFVGDEPYKERV